jgi:two-component system, NtrC family, response regulator AtoC
LLREDLLYRLNVFPIALPPLRERAADVQLLAEHMLAEVSQREGAVRHLSPAALARLEAYRWPGNVRELRNAIQRAYVMSDGDTVTDEWLPLDVPDRSLALAPPAAAAAAQGSASNANSLDGASITLPIGTSLADAEKQLILSTLRHCGQQRERTAAMLGISLKTLYNRLKDYGGDAQP